ncbi:uncharacterized protein C8A04DRAFT_28651 [Dichotomopilus funicola]|uniref:Apple domain-containing protein n=1 Tax=Dichotomopilus funicola TaxID=1934379 RepID=A0AAN6V386_9PEZI|nr:hypothetical protein C8A04DRAFT_28651 [Dichotomopilus funicola]
MDSSIQPGLSPSNNNYPNNPFDNNRQSSTSSHHTTLIIQGRDIELAPSPPPPPPPPPPAPPAEPPLPPLPTKRDFEENLANPTPEVIPHSTLEPAVPVLRNHYHQQNQQYPQNQHPQLHHATSYSSTHKTWDGTHHHHPSTLPPPFPGTIRSDSVRSYGHSAVGILPMGVAGAGDAGRYSYSNFSSPFVGHAGGGGGHGGGGIDGGLDGKGEGGGRGRGDRICGVKRQLFWIGLAIAVFVVVVAVAVGVGLGVGLGGGGGGGESESSTPTPSASSTRTLPEPTATAGPTQTHISCPLNNLTLYTPPSNPDKSYIILCGRDYNSQLSTTLDLYNTPTDSLSACVALCAGQDGCVGAGWGAGDTAGGQPVCWLKSSLGVYNDAPTWSFVVEDTEDVRRSLRLF